MLEWRSGPGCCPHRWFTGNAVLKTIEGPLMYNDASYLKFQLYTDNGD